MERKYSIDLLRVISALAVIVIHVVTGPAANYSGVLNRDLANSLDAVHAMMNWAVPVFFVITGYCIFRKEEYTYGHCWKHVRKYLLVLATVGFLYALMEEIATKRVIDCAVFFNSARNVISGNLWDHMWYVYTIIGIYLVLPVFHSFMSTGRKNRLLITGLLFFFTILIPSLKPWITIGVQIPLGGYLFYVCFGGVVANQDLSKKAIFCIVFSGLISAIWILLSPGKDALGYHSPAVCLLALGIFVLVNHLQLSPSGFITTVSSCTWGIYLIHPFFINVTVKLLKIDLLSNMAYWKLPVFFAAVLFLSFAGTYVLRKIPMIKELF